MKTSAGSVEERVRTIQSRASEVSGPVLYWMQREQRAEDNWALIYAQKCALQKQVPLCVLFTLDGEYETNSRQADFLLRGLQEVTDKLSKLNIPFVVLMGDPLQTIPKFVKNHDASHLVTDFNPLRDRLLTKHKVAEAIPITVTEVDAHNIIPCWLASDKEEFAAHTFRPKIQRQVSDWLTEIPKLKHHPYSLGKSIPVIDWSLLQKKYCSKQGVNPVSWLEPGTTAGYQEMRKFIASKLTSYATERNNPTLASTSNLSPYLNFGHISAQTVAYHINRKSSKYPESSKAYLEELIVRRELADNFCFYNSRYDQVNGAHSWAQKTIREHADDVREYIYTPADFESASTHDQLWNAMQTQMVNDGKMHGWCRMYWAKKILEWTPDNQTAVDIALYLNDKYELDGRDPNGVVGVMWSICGVHDRAWAERPIFGKVRYMNYAGAKRKFPVEKYIENNK